MKKKVNYIGIIIGLLFIGVGILISGSLYILETNSNKDYHNPIVNPRAGIAGIFLLIIGIFFIIQSLKGKSTKDIGKTDVSKYLGVKKGTSAKDYVHHNLLPGLGLWLGISAVGILFLFIQFKYYELNTWQNELACLVHYNCTKAADFEPLDFTSYTQKVERYTQENYGFYFTYPDNWLMSYKKNSIDPNSNATSAWEFRCTPLLGSPTNATTLPGNGNFKLNIYKMDSSYYDDELNEYFSKYLMVDKDSITMEDRTFGQTKGIIITSKTNTFKPRYLILGMNQAYEIIFSDDTAKNVETKIMDYSFRQFYTHPNFE